MGQTLACAAGWSGYCIREITESLNARPSTLNLSDVHTIHHNLSRGIQRYRHGGDCALYELLSLDGACRTRLVPIAGIENHRGTAGRFESQLAAGFVRLFVYGTGIL